jgi:hypothetical protein
MAIIPARILSAPIVTYENKAFSPNSGLWNLVDVKLTSSGAVTSWAVLTIGSGVAAREDPIDSYFASAVDDFRMKCAEIGLEIGPCINELRCAIQLNRDSGLADLHPVRHRLSQKAGKVTFVLVILNFYHENIYSEIKYLGDTQYGVITACVNLRKMSRGNPYYISNVALKLNLKLGGTNHAIQNDCLGSLRSGRKMIVSYSAFSRAAFEIKRV